MRWVAFICILAALGSCKEEIYFIPGTGTLPDCNDAPATDLDGTHWYDNGTVTITSTGCEGTEAGDEHQSCALDWIFTQSGNDVTIVVDEEYRLEGRICGDQLSLRGGWWLPVVDEDVGGCTYEDDSAEEVGIMSDGNVLTVAEDPMSGILRMTGTLSVQGNCSADYEVVFDHN
ncbi:MAG: hypothetical protein ACERNK_06395 [Deltaproteobacteria bacterium]